MTSSKYDCEVCGAWGTYVVAECKPLSLKLEDFPAPGKIPNPYDHVIEHRACDNEEHRQWVRVKYSRGRDPYDDRRSVLPVENLLMSEEEAREVLRRRLDHLRTQVDELRRRQAEDGDLKL